MINNNKISKCIVLSEMPIMGKFKYSDVFQILPPPEDAPRPPYTISHHPCIIEYQFNYIVEDKKFFDGNKVPDWVQINNFSSKAIKEIMTLLTAFTTNRFFLYGNNQSWYIPMDEIKTSTPRISRWGQEGYTYTRFSSSITKFSNTEKIKPVALIESNNYFNKIGHNVNSSFDLPNNITHLLSLFFELNKNQRSTFLTACSLFSQGSELWSSHPSLSFAAFVSSLETLIHYDFANVNPKVCDKCGLEKFQVTKRFLEFFKKYIGEDKKTKEFSKKIYKTRCKILHRGELFLGEITPSDFGFSNFDDNNLRRSMIRVCRICIVNWLIKNFEKQLFSS